MYNYNDKIYYVEISRDLKLAFMKLLNSFSSFNIYLILAENASQEISDQSLRKHFDIL